MHYISHNFVPHMLGLYGPSKYPSIRRDPDVLLRMTLEEAKNRQMCDIIKYCTINGEIYYQSTFVNSALMYAIQLYDINDCEIELNMRAARLNIGFSHLC